MRRLPLAVLALLFVAGCDTNGVDGICLIGDQPALNRNQVDAELFAPTLGDTLRLGEPFHLRGQVDAVGPDIVLVSARLEVVRLRPFESPETLLSEPLARASSDTTIAVDRAFTIGRLRGGVTSLSLDHDESIAVSIRSDISYPVESEGPGCGTTLAGSGGGSRYERVTVLPPR